VAAAANLFLAAGLVACSSSSGKSDSKGGVTHLTVGSAANLENVGLYHGTQSGIFAKNGLSVTPKVVTSGQQAVPQLLNGQLQFTATDPLGAILAISHKVPLVMVAPAGVVSSDPAQDSTGLLAKSNVSSLAELDGKTIAVNSVGGLGQLAVEAAIDQAGGGNADIGEQEDLDRAGAVVDVELEAERAIVEQSILEIEYPEILSAQLSVNRADGDRATQPRTTPV